MTAVALKQKLTGQTSELRSYKERVQRLQNELIKVRRRLRQREGAVTS